MIDIVYTLGLGSRWDDREIAYSLRSFEQHLASRGTVWVVGACPEMLQGVEHVPFPDPYKQNKDANKINKVLSMCVDPAVSDPFIWCSDDQCLLRDADEDSFAPCFVEELEEVEQWAERHWVKRLRNTHERLLLNGFSTFNMESHTPLMIDKQLFPKIMLQFDYGAGFGYNLATLYHNAMGTGGRPREARLVRAGFFLDEDLDRAAIDERVAGKQFLAYNDAGLNVAFKKFLAERFPTVSRFERDRSGD